MSDAPPDHARAFGDALVREIRVEMARRDIMSVRALADRIPMSHAALNDRLNKSSRTGDRVAIGGEDLWHIAAALGIEPGELVRRAAIAAQAQQKSTGVPDSA